MCAHGMPLVFPDGYADSKRLQWLSVNVRRPLDGAAWQPTLAVPAL